MTSFVAVNDVNGVLSDAFFGSEDRMQHPATTALIGTRPERAVLCFGDSNTWGAVPSRHVGDVRRFDASQRWTMRLAARLGTGWRVIEEGLPGRTTDLPDPVEGAHKDGAAYLLACLESHAPLDRLVIMLGTNDLKVRFSRSAGQIATGVKLLIDIALASGALAGGPASILVICPPPIFETGPFADMFESGAATSAHLPEAFADVLRNADVDLLTVGEMITSSRTDGIHLDAEAHRNLAEALYSWLVSGKEARWAHR